MRFSARTDGMGAVSLYGEALLRARAKPEFLDLTLSNPTRCGFSYAALPIDALSSPAVLGYEADPLGSKHARETLRSALYPRIDPARIMLTASTSEAYGYLLKLLCEPGDNVLVPSPSYPLFELLARLHDVELRTYPLLYHDGWQIDAEGLRRAMTPRTRAIVAIHPNNPTGHYCSAKDREALFRVAAEHDAALIVDEVFLDYGIEGTPAASFAEQPPPVLTFVLGGLSKLLALPQMKLAWTVACGPEQAVKEAMARLETVADTFLSPGTPVQAALPAWLPHRAAMQAQITDRVRGNLAALDSMIGASPVTRLKVEAGWSTVLRVPALEDDIALCKRMLDEAGLAVHPGSFYGFGGRGWLVVSLLLQRGDFVDGMQRLLRWILS